VISIIGNFIESGISFAAVFFRNCYFSLSLIIQLMAFKFHHTFNSILNICMLADICAYIHRSDLK
jgi:hypothetical protein